MKSAGKPKIERTICVVKFTGAMSKYVVPLQIAGSRKSRGACEVENRSA